MGGGERVLVTGASGFIGTHIVKLLQEAGYRVRGAVRNLNNEERIKPLRELCPDAIHPIELVEVDLMKDEGWYEAVKGCEFVIHTASPYKCDTCKEEDVIRPAVDGTLRVLNAIRDTKCVTRCVLTSSVVAMYGGNLGENGRTYSEADWTDPQKPGLLAIVKSKTMAEKAAWDFVNETKGEFELAVINPAMVFGPVLCGGSGVSIDIPAEILMREMPVLINMCLPVADVRDVAKAHVVAMTSPEAAGKRHAIYSKSLWFKDIAQILSDEFKPQGYKVSLCMLPNWVLWIASVFNRTCRGMYPHLGHMMYVDNTRMRTVLGIEPIEPRKSLIDMAYSLIERGVIKKTPEYTGRQEKQNTDIYPKLNEKQLTETSTVIKVN